MNSPKNCSRNLFLLGSVVLGVGFIPLIKTLVRWGLRVGPSRVVSTLLERVKPSPECVDVVCKVSTVLGDTS